MSTHPELDGPVPSCFKPNEWAEYVRDERECEREPGYKPDRNGYCRFCTLAHKTVMVAAGRCEHPSVKFVVFEGDEYGVRRNPILRARS